MKRAVGGSINVGNTSSGLLATEKPLLVCLIFFLLLTFSFCYQISVCRASPISPARISPVPPVYIADSVGEVFGIALEVSGIEGLHSARLAVAYDSVLLSAQEVVPGSFLPGDAWFYWAIDEASGLVDLEISLSSPHETVSGSGVLAELFFEVEQSSFENGWSTVRFVECKLHGLDHEELDCRSVGAVLFWQSATPSAPDDERRIDLYTSQGGIGLGESAGWFGYGDLVTLKANVTYADWPQQNGLVAFQVINPQNDTVLVLVVQTDENGTAEISFRIPEILDSVGLWTAIASVDIACQTVWDTLTFSVSSPVGGETTAIERHLGHSVHLAIIGILALGFAISRKVFWGSSRSSPSDSSIVHSSARTVSKRRGALNGE